MPARPGCPEVRIGSLVLLGAAAATVGLVHSILPDHWVPLAVVARTQRWSLVRVARVSGMAAGGHVVASLALAGVIALVGLRFQHEVDVQQGHIVGAVLVLTGLGFFVWGMTGHGHAHDHDHDSHQHDGEKQHYDHDSHDHDPHEHEHVVTSVPDAAHEHEHAHGTELHSHPHSHEAFVENRVQFLAERSEQRTLAARLATIAVPFGVAASPDLTILPVALAASAYGGGAVVTVLGIFGAVTMCTFVGLTVIATVAGYQVKGEWLERHANSITSLVLVAIGLVAFLGF